MLQLSECTLWAREGLLPSVTPQAPETFRSQTYALRRRQDTFPAPPVPGIILPCPKAQARGPKRLQGKWPCGSLPLGV